MDKQDLNTSEELRTADNDAIKKAIEALKQFDSSRGIFAEEGYPEIEDAMNYFEKVKHFNKLYLENLFK